MNNRNYNGTDKLRLLIADDEPSVTNLLCSLLSDHYDCATVSSAEEALTKLRTECFAVLLTDINMSGISGLQMIPQVREISPQTVVVMISGEQSIQSAIEAMRAGAFDYITKPFDLDHIEAAVSRALAHYSLLVSKQNYEIHLEESVAERTAELQSANTDLERQIVERKLAEEKIEFMAYYDALTELPNQRLFNNRLSYVLKNAHNKQQKIVVFLLSPDRCKTINDTLGYETHEQLLRQIAERLKSVPETNTAAFLGSDEFALFFTEIKGDAGEIARFAVNVQEILRPSFNCGGHELFINFSIGISTFSDEGEDCQTMTQNASNALFRAKEKGGNCYEFYAADLHELALKRLALEASLRQALEREEFRVFYQPQVNTKNEKIVGMEALVRWNHPELGLVSPLDFIPVAEETGLIVPLGEWVLREACRQNMAWQNAGYEPLRLGVNLSLRQFEQIDLLEMISRVIDETGFDKCLLELELTESMMMHDSGKAIEVLKKLKKIGIKISVDDFGSGYSSLSYLKHLPLDVLKIDRSFINEINVDKKGAAIIIAIITLAQNLGLKVIAEGVETEEQFELLRRLECDEVQGYFFGKPMPAEDFENLLNK